MFLAKLFDKNTQNLNPGIIVIFFGTFEGHIINPHTNLLCDQCPFIE